MEVNVVNSSIKGYHFFKIQPHDSIEMNVVKDSHIPYDPSAMIVKIPNHVSPSLLNDVTRETRPGRPEQIVKDILGKDVGRIPANLGKLFLGLLANYIVGCIYKHPHYSIDEFVGNYSL